MKNFIILGALLSVLLLTAFIASGCGIILVPKDGEIVPAETETREYDFTEFTRLDISSSFHYEVIQSDTYSVSITASNNLFDEIKVTQEGRTLIIGLETSGVSWALIKVNPSVKVVIAMPQLEEMNSSGATIGTISGFFPTNPLDIQVSGASSIELIRISTGDITFDVSGSSKATGEIETKNIGIKMSGASTVQMEGSAISMVADVSGSSKLSLADLKVENARVAFSGASSGIINLDGSLDAKLSGSSRLEYIGDPTLGIVDITGASSLRKK